MNEQTTDVWEKAESSVSLSDSPQCRYEAIGNRDRQLLLKRSGQALNPANQHCSIAAQMCRHSGQCCLSD